MFYKLTDNNTSSKKSYSLSSQQISHQKIGIKISLTKWQYKPIFFIWSSSKSLKIFQSSNVTKTQTHWVLSSRENSCCRNFECSNLNVFYVARKRPFHTRIGESSQNGKYTVTSFIAMVFISSLCGHNIGTLRCPRFMGCFNKDRQNFS